MLNGCTMEFIVRSKLGPIDPNGPLWVLKLDQNSIFLFFENRSIFFSDFNPYFIFVFHLFHLFRLFHFFWFFFDFFDKKIKKKLLKFYFIWYFFPSCGGPLNHLLVKYKILPKHLVFTIQMLVFIFSITYSS